MFYAFRQNNSGGHYLLDPKRHIGHYVMVEAETYKEATEYMREAGLYDLSYCTCCGGRFGYGEGYETLGEALRDSRPTLKKETYHVYLHLATGVRGGPILI